MVILIKLIIVMTQDIHYFVYNLEFRLLVRTSTFGVHTDLFGSLIIILERVNKLNDIAGLSSNIIVRAYSPTY